VLIVVAAQTLVPLAIGVCVTCCHLMSLPITGTSLNPTRSFASAVVASNVKGCEYVWDSHWVFWFGPFFGGIMGAFIYEYCFLEGGRKFDNLLNMYRRKTGN
jgi:glycerol uptake facilitator-like aquaporin